MKQKCAALKELEKGDPKTSLKSITYPRTLYQHGLKRQTLCSSRKKKGSNIKQQILRKANYDSVDQAVFKWFLKVRSQNRPASGVLIQEKALQYAKALGIADFNAADGWIRRPKE